MNRFLDIFFSFIGLLILSPLFLVPALLIVCESKGPVFYCQTRVGKGNRDFKLFKFRTMRQGSDKKGLITVGQRDTRITQTGYYLRKYKIDELPQLLNVLIGDMSFVGPRPEVRKYVDMYTPEQKIVLTLRPGITDYASLEYINENEILSQSENPEQCYIEEIMPAKIELNRRFIANPSTKQYFKILLLTIKKIFL